MLKWLVNSGWWLGNRHSRESRMLRCCHPGLRAGIASVKSSWRPAGAIGSIAVLFALVFLSACTDYVSQIEDRYGEWNVGQVYVPAEESSSSVAFPMSSWSGGGAGAIGSITDSRDGQSYKTVTIGTQTWMAQNLNYKTTNSFCYEDSASNCTKYGRLYTWDAAPTACPSDWHLPTKAEFETLLAAVGGESTAGKMLKATSGWGNSANGVDEYSFSVLPAGYKVNNGGYENEGDFTYFWTSTEVNSSRAYVMGMSFSRDAGLIDADKNYGYSVRCVKGKTTEKTSSSNKEKMSSSSKKIESSSSITSSSSWSGGGAGAIGSITDTRDGQSYKTVTIGTQTWMAQNLNYETANSYCYSNTPSNCTKYGRLYTWAAAMDSAGTWSTNGKGCGDAKTCTPTYPVRGVCPTGWHLPTKAEFETLITAVGDSSTAGTKLKSTSGWNGKNGNGTDAYSFSALPAGYRGSNEGCYYEGDNAYFWSSTEDDSNYACRMDLYYGNGSANLYSSSKNYGFSVRCVKD